MPTDDDSADPRVNETLRFLLLAPVGILLGYGVWSLFLPAELGLDSVLDPFTFVFLLFAVLVTVLAFASART
jgi:hypothetical protein